MSESPDEPRLLHRTSQYGYTTHPARALRSEPEAISATAQDDITARAQRTARQQQIDEWRERRQRIAREIDWLQSQRFVRDVRSATRALQRQLDRLDARIAG